MANQSIGLGSAADDGTGDNLRVAIDKVNDNFLEIYTLIGDASSLTSGISATATVVTLTAPTITGVVGGTQTSATITTLTGTTLNAGTLAIAAGSITDSSGAISFGNENITTTGTITGALATAAQTAITSVGTLTALQVDNININANAITSTAGTDLTITPLSGQQIVLDGTIVVDAGVVTGATSITSTALVGALTGNSTTATALATARTIGGTSFDGSANIAVALATLATTVTITDNESTDEDNALIFTAGGDVDGGDVGLESDGTLTYNPSTGVVTATGFVGALTGNVTGNASGTAATVTGAAQANITSVGTLTTLTVDNIIINGANIGHTSDTDSIAIASDGVATLSQKDVHSVGLSVKNGATSAGFIEFFEDSNNGTNKVTLIGPASTADVTLTLGSTTGTVATTDDIAGEATALAIALG